MMLRNALQPAPIPLDMHKIQAHAKKNPQSWSHSGRSSPTPSNATLGSLSWFAERSATELIPLLKEAYSALREKERDLYMAAEIGKSLLENNVALKGKYESLLQQLQMYREAQSRPRITNGDKGEIPDINVEAADEKDLIPDTPYSDTDENPMDSPRNKNRLRGRGRSPSTSRAQQAAMAEIEKLEKEKEDLQVKLEASMKEQEELEKQNRMKQKLFEKEVDALKSDLEGASQKVVELEEEKEKLEEVKKNLLVENPNVRMGRHSPKGKGGVTESGKEEGDDEMINSLLEKLEALEETNNGLKSTKTTLEQKLKDTLRDLNSLKSEFEQCDFTQEDYRNLQEAYQRQFKHITELNESLEEHRNMLVSVREKQQLRGPSSRRRHHSPGSEEGEVLRDSIGSRYSQSSRSPSVNGGSPSPHMTRSSSGLRRGRRDSVSSWSTVLSDATEMMEGLMGMTSTKKSRLPRKTLLSELENEWFRKAGANNNLDTLSESHHSSSSERSVVIDGIPEENLSASQNTNTTTNSDSTNQSLPLRGESPYFPATNGTNVTTPEPIPPKSFTQYLTSPGELALDTLLARTGFDRSFLDECFDLINEAQSIGLFEDEFGSQFYPSSEFDQMEDRMGMMGMVTTQEGGEIVERKGLVGWVVRVLRRIFRAIWRWCRFLGVLVAAVVISVMKGPDEMLLENESEW